MKPTGFCNGKIAKFEEFRLKYWLVEKQADFTRDRTKHSGDTHFGRCCSKGFWQGPPVIPIIFSASPAPPALGVVEPCQEQTGVIRGALPIS